MIARYVEVMLMGWKLAFSTNTGSFMAHQLDYISFGKVVRSEKFFEKYTFLMSGAVNSSNFPL